MRKRFLTILLAVVLLAPQSAFSWKGPGHMMVAAVAYQKLNQATKDDVDAPVAVESGSGQRLEQEMRNYGYYR